MHLLQDENGNPIPHGDEEGHEHEHDHEGHVHEDGCPAKEGEDCQAHEHCEVKEGGSCPHGHGDHEHDHSHQHGHGHHHHDHGPMDTKEQMAVLLDYMLKHNQSHAGELDKMAAKLAEKDLPEASEQVRKAVDEFTKGNLYLSLALSLVKEG